MDPARQRPQARLPVEIGAQDQAVDQEADDPLVLETDAPCHRGAESEVPLTGESPQDRLPGRHQDRERRHLEFPRQGFDPRGPGLGPTQAQAAGAVPATGFPLG